MASLFGPPLMGNTGIMGTGMPGYQVPRYRNQRPDTPEEIAARMGMPPPPEARGGTTLYNQPQVFPGNTFGSQDWARAATFLGNDAYNAMGGPLALLNNVMGGLSPQVMSTYSSVLGGQLPPAFTQMLNEQLQNQLTPAISNINARVPTMIRQATDNLSGGNLAEAIMGSIESPVSAIAQLEGGLRGQMLQNQMGLFSGLLNSALQAGDPNTVAQNASQLAAQRGLVPWSITQGFGGLANQRYLGQLAGKSGGK